MIVSTTGHRKPEGYTYTQLTAIAAAALRQHRPDAVISGMALGWDQAFAEAAMGLGIPVRAYLPFRGQADRWTNPDVLRYTRLLQACESIRKVSEDYHDRAYQDRNEAMVDDCDLVLSFWDGSSGGTGNCVRYAKKVGKPIENLWFEV